MNGEDELTSTSLIRCRSTEMQPQLVIDHNALPDGVQGAWT